MFFFKERFFNKEKIWRPLKNALYWTIPQLTDPRGRGWVTFPKKKTSQSLWKIKPASHYPPPPGEIGLSRVSLKIPFRKFFKRLRHPSSNYPTPGGRPPPLVVNRANASSTRGGCQKSPKGGVNDKPWFLMQNVSTGGGGNSVREN